MLSLEAAPDGPLIVPPADQSAVEVSLIVPTFNEGENVREFLRAVQRVLDAEIPGRYEVIVVDDDSPDRTWELAASLGGFPGLRVVVRRCERGLARAVIRGWQVSRGNFIGTINADFQHPPEVLGPMVRALSGNDLVVASRYVEGGGLGNWHWFRRLTSKAAHTFGTLVLPQVFGRIADPLSGCYLVRRSAIAGVELHPLGYKTLMEITARGRIGTVQECGYQMRDRERGQSKAGMRHTLEYLRHLLRLRKAIGELRSPGSCSLCSRGGGSLRSRGVSSLRSRGVSSLRSRGVSSLGLAGICSRCSRGLARFARGVGGWRRDR